MLAMFHLGRAILEPAETCVQSGGTSTLQAGVAEKFKFPPLWAQVWRVQAGPPTQLYTMFGIKSTKHLNKYIHSLRIY